MNASRIKTILTMLVLFGLFFWSLQFSKEKKAEYEAKNPSSSSLVNKVSSSSLAQSVAVSQSSNLDTTKKDSLVPVVAVAQRRIVVKTDNFILTLDNTGAKISSIIFNGLKDSKNQNPSILQNDTLGALSFSLSSKDFSKEVFEVSGSLQDTLVLRGKDSKVIDFTWKNGNQQVVRSFTITGDAYAIPVQLRTTGFDPASGLNLHWDGGMKETDAEKIHREGFIGTDYFFSEAIYNDGSEVIREQLGETKIFNQEHGQVQWAGMRRKYVAGVIDFGKPMEGILSYDILQTQETNKNIKASYKLKIEDKLENGTYNFKFVLLPLEYHKLKEFDRQYQDILWSGYGWFFGADSWFPWLCGITLKLLNIFYGWLGNYGLAIILLTLFVRAVTTPLTLSQLRSTRLLQEHKPALDKIKEQFGKDPRKYQEEVMGYYRSNGINPMAPLLGCFPVLLQMPVFIALFVVLARAVELRDASFFGWITDLSSPDILVEAIKIPMIMPAGLSLLPFLMAITSWYQTKQTITDPNMKMMVWMMPLMMFLFSGLMPSGLVVYWIVSNIYSIVQYMLIGKPKVNPEAALVQGKQSFQKNTGKKKK